MSNLRVGQGFDSHTLFSNPFSSKPFILGGVMISKNIEVNAYSDGDTLIHSLIDAILGALALGDIGEIFPNQSIDFKDISSLMLLEKILKITKYQDIWKFVNIDITIILENPQLGPFKMDIKNNLKNRFFLNPSEVSIKAKSFENPEAKQVWVYSNILIELLNKEGIRKR